MSARALTTALLLATTPAVAQRTVEARRITMPTRDAGIYHLATGTWTRGAGAQAGLGPDVIYRADAPSGYFAVGWNGIEGIDDLVLPGTGNAKKAGPQEVYHIDGFHFEYCTLDSIPFPWTLRFYDSYPVCANPDVPPACTHKAGEVGLPAMPAAGSCWAVTVDLAGSGLEFCMQADGGPCYPGYQGGGGGRDHGGWGAVNNALSATGPVLAGYDPTWVPEGEGTCYDPGLTCAAGSTGLGARDIFAIGTPLNGCFWFGGYVNKNGCGGPSKVPGAQFLMRLYTDCSQACTPCQVGTYCDTNPDNVAELELSFCSCASGSIPLRLSGAAPNRFGYPLVGAGTGTVTDPPGTQGDLCLVGATIGRYLQDGLFTDAAGEASVDLLNALSGGGGGNLPTIGGNLCNPAGQTWNFQWWYRDGMKPSRFSKAITATFN